MSAVVIEGGHRGPPLQTTYVTRRRGRPLCRPVDNGCTLGKALDGGTDCHVGALPLLAMTRRGIDKKLKAGIIVNRKRALPVDGCPSAG